MTAERIAFAGTNELLDIFASPLITIVSAMKTIKGTGKAWAVTGASELIERATWGLPEGIQRRRNQLVFTPAGFANHDFAMKGPSH